MTNKLVTLLRQRREELVAIETSLKSWCRVTEWHARTRPLIAQHFKNQIESFDKLLEVRWTKLARVISSLDGRNNTSKGDAAERAANERIVVNTKDKLIAHMDALIELLDLETATARNDQEQSDYCAGRGVFLVHGRNERWLQQVARFVERFDLQVVVLRDEPNQGRTVIEKFEEVVNNIGFAIVLLTGDDRGGLKEDAPNTYLPRSRQNVILELGFFLGRLRRSHVCALYEEGVEIPSDYSGVLFVKIDEPGSWRLLLAREMKAAGLPIDMNNVL
jgi:predicted nucleotide-binding protein